MRRTRNKIPFNVALVLLVCALGSTRQSSAAEQSGAIEPALKADAQITVVLNGLKEGASTLLPKPRVTGDLNATARRYNLHTNGPGRRNYCIKLVWMPDRKRAIYCGANHGVPHRLNDVWEYDLASNTWVCLYGPDDLGRAGEKWGDAWPNVALRDGVLRTRRGGPAIIGHQWCQATYVADAKVMLFNNEWPFSYYPKEIQEQYLKGGKYKHVMPLWTFSPAERTWTPVRTEGPAPPPGRPMNKYLDYVPALEGCVFVDTSNLAAGTWLFRLKDRTWKELLPGESNAKKANKNPNLPHRLGVMVYCPDKQRLVACTTSTGGEGRTVQYDIKENAWAQTAGGFEIPIGHPAFTPFGYDATTGRMYLFEAAHHFQKEKRTALWAYDVENKQWEKLSPQGPMPPSKGMGYFDPARNVFVICAKDNVWLYRPKSKTANTKQ